MRQDLDLLQGSWTVTSLEVEGQELPVARGRLVIKGNRFTTTGMGAVYKGKLELDDSRNPRQLDMKFDDGPEKGNTNLCIYELEGDAWKICIATRGKVLPSSFASPPGSGFALETLTRDARKAAEAKAPATKKAPPRSGPATEFEGEWRMISGILDGETMDKPLVKWMKRVTRGNQTTVYAGPQVVMEFEFTRDPSKSPKTIDYHHTAGPNGGECTVRHLRI